MTHYIGKFQWYRLFFLAAIVLVTISCDGTAKQTSANLNSNGFSAKPATGAVVLNWNPVIDAISYNVYYSDNSQLPKNQWTLIVTTNTQIEIDGLEAKTYYFAFEAVTNTGPGSLSVVISATPMGSNTTSVRSLSPSDLPMLFSVYDLWGTDVSNVYAVGANKVSGV
ncbi:MAG: fibronectin type III domain-containing protein, partial [Gammaproteobacteria bacterium]|nr:fibronectin type III domain-containing protein [Gammaproteobacteria bacterium]